MTTELPVDDARAARAAQRAERMNRLRATAVCTVIDSPTPRGIPQDEPTLVVAETVCCAETVADMALPAPQPEPIPTAPPPPRPASEWEQLSSLMSEHAPAAESGGIDSLSLDSSSFDESARSEQPSADHSRTELWSDLAASQGTSTHPAPDAPWEQIESLWPSATPQPSVEPDAANAKSPIAHLPSSPAPAAFAATPPTAAQPAPLDSPPAPAIGPAPVTPSPLPTPSLRPSVSAVHSTPSADPPSVSSVASLVGNPSPTAQTTQPGNWPPAAEMLSSVNTPNSGASNPPVAATSTLSQSASRVFRLDPPESAVPRAPFALPAFALAKSAEESPPDANGQPSAEPSPYAVGDHYRQLRTNVLSRLSPEHGSMVWISPTGSEPLSDHLVELASALAESCEGEVLLVDANFHAGALTRRFNMAEKSGLADVLAKKIQAHGAGHETAVARVRVLPKGAETARTSRPSSDAEWKSLLTSLKERYRYVLVDAPGVEEPHCLSLAKAADAAFLAIALDHTPRETVQEALEHLHLHKARVAGCVITNAPR